MCLAGVSLPMSSPRYQGTEPVETLPRPSPAPRQHDTPWVVSWSLSLAATGQRGRGGWRDRHHAAQNPLLPAAVCGVCVCVQAHVAHVCQDRRPDPRPRVSLATETGIAAAAAAAAAPRSPSSEHSRLTPPPRRSHRTNPRAQFELRLVKLGGPWPDLGFFSGFRFELSQPVASQSRLDQLSSPALLSDCSESLLRGHVRLVAKRPNSVAADLDT